MSKKKSGGWARKSTGHISTGVTNYEHVTKFGRSGSKNTNKRRGGTVMSRLRKAIRNQSPQTNRRTLDLQLKRYLGDI